jgi:guanylate kinase
MTPFPLILSAPSGGGKTTIARMLQARRPDIGYSVSCTTRQPRAGEVNGVDYFFLTHDEFARRRAQGEFAESAEVHGQLYGTLRSEVERVLASGKHVVMDIDVQGAGQFVAAFPSSVLVFILPPSVEELVARLRGRNTERPEALAKRLRGAREELRAASSYHYVVVNDDVEQAYAQVSSIVDAEMVRHERLPEFERTIRELGEALERQIHSHSMQE